MFYAVQKARVIFPVKTSLDFFKYKYMFGLVQFWAIVSVR